MVMFFLVNLLKVGWFGKADWRAVDSPKKRTDEFDLFAVKSKKANKTNSSFRFLGESMARQSVYGFIWPLGPIVHYTAPMIIQKLFKLAKLVHIIQSRRYFKAGQKIRARLNHVVFTVHTLVCKGFSV